MKNVCVWSGGAGGGGGCYRGFFVVVLFVFTFSLQNDFLQLVGFSFPVNLELR